MNTLKSARRAMLRLSVKTVTKILSSPHGVPESEEALGYDVVNDLGVELAEVAEEVPEPREGLADLRADHLKLRLRARDELVDL